MNTEKIDFLQSRLATAKEQLLEEQNYFKVMVENEMNTSCFEKNAISALNNMLEIRTRIRELEFALQILQIQE